MKKYSTCTVQYHVEFPSKRCISNKKRVIITHFTLKIICAHLYIACTKIILFVKKYLSLLWVFTDFSLLLVAFWTLTLWKRVINRTARTLEAECWQVCGEAWVRGQKKMSQVLGAFGLLDFTMLRPVLAWRAFWNLWTYYFFNFPIFFGGGGTPAVNRIYWIRGYGDPPVYIYIYI